MRNHMRPAYRRVCRAKAKRMWAQRPFLRLAAALPCRPLFWAPPPNPARQLAALVRAIIKFHQSEPLLSNGKDVQ